MKADGRSGQEPHQPAFEVTDLEHRVPKFCHLRIGSVTRHAAPEAETRSVSARGRIMALRAFDALALHAATARHGECIVSHMRQPETDLDIDRRTRAADGKESVGTRADTPRRDRPWAI